MQPRTLDRRLKAYGLSFQDLVDEGRYEIARQALLDTDMNVAHVAALLDYADASSFVRAFRRWCGLTPMQWRKQHQAAERPFGRTEIGKRCAKERRQRVTYVIVEPLHANFPILLMQPRAPRARRRARTSRAKPSATGSTVRMGTALVIPALLKRLGVDPVEVLTEAGVDMKLFDDPEYTISLAAHNRIVQHCADRTRCAHFGLLVGQQDGLQSLGLVGLLVRYSTDVHTALNAFVRHLGVHVRGAHATLAIEGKTALLSWEIHEPGVAAHRPGRRRRHRCLLQHSPGALRPGLEADRGLVRAPPAGRHRPLPPVLPGPTAL